MYNLLVCCTICSFGERITDCKLHLEKSISSLVDHFSYHSLKLNSEKTVFIVFGTSSAAESIKVDNHIIKEVENVKYLGVILDKKLYQQQVKQILSKMAQGIKTLCLQKRSTIPFAQNPAEFSCNYSSPVLSCFAFVQFKKI